MSGFLSPNPYARWANCGLGSTVMTEELQEVTMAFGSYRNVVFATHTLLALDGDKATVEMEIRSTANGAPLHLKHTVEIPARPEPEKERHSAWSSEDGTENAEVTSVSFDQIFHGATPEETGETLKVAGRPLVCRKIAYETTQDGQPLSVAYWMSDQVPGGLVRMESRMGKSQVTTMTVISFEKK